MDFVFLREGNADSHLLVMLFLKQNSWADEIVFLTFLPQFRARSSCFHGYAINLTNGGITADTHVRKG